jgi:hypothetical protein
MSAVDNNKHKYELGEKVFAKVKGHSHWPAFIDSYEANLKYKVIFYGTSESAIVKEINICPYLENKARYGKLKNKHFLKAVKEIELSFSNAKKINKSQNKSMNITNKNESTITVEPSASSSPLHPTNTQTNTDMTINSKA